MKSLVGNQLRKPDGFFGKIIAFLMEKGNREFYTKCFAELNIQTNNSIFEIGYGPGYGIEILAKEYNPKLISGIDFSTLMYRMASERIRFIGKPDQINLYSGDFLELSNEEKFDKVLCINVIYFWGDLKIAFEKVYSILKQNGKFVLFMQDASRLEKLKFTNEFYKYEPDVVIQALITAGFSSIKVKNENGIYISGQRFEN